MSDRQSTRVQVGSVSLLVSPHSKGFRFGWKDDNGEWRYTTKKKKKDAVDAARDRARLLSNGAADALLTPDELALWNRIKRLGITHADVDAWEKSRNFYSKPVSEVIAAMVQEKAAARGGEGAHLHIVKRDLATLPQEPLISAITTAEIVLWLDGHRQRNVGLRRLKNLRSSAVTLFRWAQKRGWLPEGVTAPEKTEEISETRGRGRANATVEIYTPEELLALYEAVPDYWRPFIAMAAFSGLRSEELMPEYRTRKDGLDWSHVDRAHGVIRVPASVSKTGHSRIIPIQKNLAAWLDHLQVPTAGPIIKGSPSNAHNERRAKTADLWKTNGLRHSYGSYRVAQTQNLPQVALEMGNSVPMIRKHYLEVVTQAKGEEWFNIFPRS